MPDQSHNLMKQWLPITAVVAVVGVALAVGVRMAELTATSTLARENAKAIKQLQAQDGDHSVGEARLAAQLDEIIRRLERIERMQEGNTP